MCVIKYYHDNIELFTDLYQLTMMAGYLENGIADTTVVYDLFYREAPFGGNYIIAAGLEQVISYIKNLRFDDEDINYIKSIRHFNDSFLEALRSFRFTGEILAVPEGTIVFPNEPIIQVKARIFEAQLIETALLNIVGHQSLIATKACRIFSVAEGRPIIEMGSRRAQGISAAIYGSRAAIIGGCDSTTNVLAARIFGLNLAGTHGHSWVTGHDNELEAFRSYSRYYNDNLIFLVDTYNVLKSGLPNAIKVFKEVKKKNGSLHRFGIRIDSGDLAYLSKKARSMLKVEGFSDALIVVSNDLDEYKIRDLLQQKAEIDSFGVGTHLITASDQPTLGCVYKMSAKQNAGNWIPILKKSENTHKVNLPGIKKTLRFIRDGKAVVDLIMLHDESIPHQSFEVIDPINEWKKKTVDNADGLELLVPIFKEGQLLYKLPTLLEIKLNVCRNLSYYTDEHTRLSNPHIYDVILSRKLYNLRQHLLSEAI